MAIATRAVRLAAPRTLRDSAPGARALATARAPRSRSRVQVRPSDSGSTLVPADRRHEVGVPVPARHQMEVQVPGKPGARRRGRRWRRSSCRAAGTPAPAPARRARRDRAGRRAPSALEVARSGPTWRATATIRCAGIVGKAVEHQERVRPPRRAPGRRDRRVVSHTRQNRHAAGAARRLRPCAPPRM